MRPSKNFNRVFKSASLKSARNFRSVPPSLCRFGRRVAGRHRDIAFGQRACGSGRLGRRSYDITGRIGFSDRPALGSFARRIGIDKAYRLYLRFVARLQEQRIRIRSVHVARRVVRFEARIGAECHIVNVNRSESPYAVYDNVMRIRLRKIYRHCNRSPAVVLLRHIRSARPCPYRISAVETEQRKMRVVRIVVHDDRIQSGKRTEIERGAFRKVRI